MKNEQTRICQGDKLRGRGHVPVMGMARQGLDAHNVPVTVPTRTVMRAKTRNLWGPDCHTSWEQTSPCVQGALFTF